MSIVRSLAPDTGYLACPVCGALQLSVFCVGFDSGTPVVDALVCSACQPPVVIDVYQGWLELPRRAEAQEGDDMPPDSTGTVH